MGSNKINKQKISRKKFLQISGSVIAGGSILGASGILLRNRANHPDLALDGQGNIITKSNGHLGKGTFASPYKLISSFSVPDRIEGFELDGNKMIVATPGNIFIYDQTGILLDNFAIGSNLRDIAIDNNLIYLLFPTRIEVYNLEGALQREWGACSDQSDYCSMAVAAGSVFVTDAANKNICKYTTDGNLEKFITSPNGFIIPSYSFGITYTNGTIYCSNSGRHKIECYSPDGEYIGTFGKAGSANGMFCGCCNPVHLTYTSAGEIITSEKGNPRISCYSSNGEFRSLLLDSKALGGGNVAYDVKVGNDKLFIAGKNLLSTFQYDKVLAAKTACSDCGVDCPLRKGT